MVCLRCGAPLKEGCLYCSSCGQEAQIVSEVNILEDDLLREIMDEKEEKSSSVTKTDEYHPKKNNKKEAAKRKKMQQTLIVMIVILVVAVAAVFGIVKYNQSHSTTYLMNKAEIAYGQKDYQDAMVYLDKVLALEPENQDALLMSGQIKASMKDYDAAQQLLEKVLKLDESCAEAYEKLIEIYAAQGQTNRILSLMKGVTDNDILALFEDYIVPVPEIDVESGAYSEYFTVEISAPKKNLKIYYTLDGKTPTRRDFLYEDPVEISQQGKTVLTAVCMDEDGNYSEPVSAEYEVELEAPDMPSVSPDGGRFSMPSSVTVTVPSGVTVYYTWDGTTPDTDSEKYSGPIDIPEGNNILSLVAIDGNGMKSEVLKCNYIYYPESHQEATEAVSGDGI